MSSTRRMFLGAAASAPLAAAPGAMPIIDTHFHLYDQTRPQGAPYPFTPGAPPFLPQHYREAAVPLGIVGGIKVEASPWVEDNLWVLMMIEKEPLIVGMVGNLDPLKQDFLEFLERYHRNKLFLGIRYGNIWEGHNIVTAVERPDFIANMKAFAQTGLTFEVANPRLDLISATRRLLEKVPNLRVVLGHLQALPLPGEPKVLKSYTGDLEALEKMGAFVKVSGVPRPRGQTSGPFDPGVYRPVLDLIWGVFGEDKIVYSGHNKAALEVLQAYVGGKGQSAVEKYFWKNSIPAFRWVRRDEKQPRASA